MKPCAARDDRTRAATSAGSPWPRSEPCGNWHRPLRWPVATGTGGHFPVSRRPGRHGHSSGQATSTSYPTTSNLSWTSLPHDAAEPPHSSARAAVPPSKAAAVSRRPRSRQNEVWVPFASSCSRWPPVPLTIGNRWPTGRCSPITSTSTAADVLTTGWDQLAGRRCRRGRHRRVAQGAARSTVWNLVRLRDGGQAANTVCLAAARHHVLAEAGWDVEQAGLIGAPAVRVVANGERHATIDRALHLLGLGAGVLEPVATDPQGAIDVSDLARVLARGSAGPTIVCLQAGNVNSGGSTISARRPHPPIATERGCTWMEPSDSGPRPTPPLATALAQDQS